MKITGFETFLANAGLRNYLFIRLRTDTGLTGIGEATLEWQEKTVETLLHEWVEAPGAGQRSVRHRGDDRRHDPRPVPGRLDGHDGDQRRRDRDVGPDRQGVRPAGLPPAGRPLPRPHPHLRQRLVRRGAHAGGICRAGGPAVERGYRALKFDPFGTAWKSLEPRGSRPGGRDRGGGPEGRRAAGRA